MIFWIFFWYHLIHWNSKPLYFLWIPKRGKWTCLNFELKSHFFTLESRALTVFVLLVTCVLLWLSDCLVSHDHDRDIARSRSWAHAACSWQAGFLWKVTCFYVFSFACVMNKETLILEPSLLFLSMKCYFIIFLLWQRGRNLSNFMFNVLTLIICLHFYIMHTLRGSFLSLNIFNWYQTPCPIAHTLN